MPRSNWANLRNIAMLKNSILNQLGDGSLGLPKDYPIPPVNDNSLFYIQRNQNKNTVVYELNRNLDGFPHADFPMHIFWIKYNEGGEQKELNYIQNKLAYGYESKAIDTHTFQFNFVSYPVLKFYIGKKVDQQYRVCCNIDNQMSVLQNIYVYAEELGVFPNPKFIELFGTDIETGKETYQKINL